MHPEERSYEPSKLSDFVVVDRRRIIVRRRSSSSPSRVIVVVPSDVVPHVDVERVNLDRIARAMPVIGCAGAHPAAAPRRCSSPSSITTDVIAPEAPPP